MKLKRTQLMDLFHQLDAPAMSEMRGEYRAYLLDSGYVINMFLAKLYLHFTWGDWQHKAFEPLGDRNGHGYNTFITTQSHLVENYFAATLMKIVSLVRSLFRLNSPQRLARIMLNKTSMVSSVFDGRPSFQLSYRDYNTFYTNTMTDEVRRVNDTLYLGIGRLTITFGKYNPMPFMLVGPVNPWVGPDIPYPRG
ncbi:MAG TPA: hypothetical protein PLT09_09500 [Deltaproteobacteria bacterium]|nr:hypothetical protein [Deltaproteobacteria bacterium]HPR55884.1 hypothetical protein [Deltaproteobacteria bacterium]HXK47665.1 hypothetical protein [Deltaproteobacteria bacterium]